MKNAKIFVPGLIALTLVLSACSEFGGEDEDDAKPGGVPKVEATP